MIFITAMFPVLPEHAEAWPELSREFTEATRAEEGCLWFDWSRSLDDPTVYVLVEAFRDDAAGGAHVQSAHFRKATDRAARLPRGDAPDRQRDGGGHRLVSPGRDGGPRARLSRQPVQCRSKRGISARAGCVDGGYSAS